MLLHQRAALLPVDASHALPRHRQRNFSFVGDGGGGPGDGELDPLQPPQRRGIRGNVNLLGEPSLRYLGKARGSLRASSRRLQLLEGNETMQLPASAVTLQNWSSWSPSTQFLPDPNRRLAWFHIPKCSTSIGTTFGHYLKPELEEDAAMPACTPDDPCDGGIPEVQFSKRYALPENIMWAKNGNWGDHAAIDDQTWAEFRGHFVGLFRDPIRRGISAYKWFGEPIGQDRESYARRIQGTTVRMMAGQRYGLDCNWPDQFPCDSGEKQEPANLDKAIERLSGFKYVGMTDEYPLSVCLFHAMFGGECRPSEFGNMRQTSKLKGAHKSEHSADEELTGAEPLAGVVDDEETTFFLAAYDRYCSDLREWRVTQRHCRDVVCPRAAEHFEDAPDGGKHCSDDRRPGLEAFLRRNNTAELQVQLELHRRGDGSPSLGRTSRGVV
jgi:hypothetical protein